MQRTRPVVEATARVARDRIRLGEWVIPKHHAVIASITMAHQSEQNFPDAKTFNPDRFLGGNPDTHTWIPFGGGISGANSNSAPGLPRASGLTPEVSPPRPDVAAGPLSGLRV